MSSSFENFAEIASPSLKGAHQYESDWIESEHYVFTRQKRLSISKGNASTNVSFFNATPNTAKSKALSLITELDFDLSRRHDIQSIERKICVDKETEERLQASSLSGSKRKLSSFDGFTSNEVTSLRGKRHSSVAARTVHVSAPSTSQPNFTTRTIHASAPPIPKSPSRLLSSLYDDNPSPHRNDSTFHTNHSMDVLSKYSWKKNYFTKHNDDDEREYQLPFPREIAGLYSCYGFEPLLSIELSESVDDEYDDEVETDITSKINQDRGGIAYPYGNCQNSALFGVYDGHGDGGENIAQYCLSEIQRRLELHPDFQINVSRALKDTFIAVNKTLSDEETIEPYNSGSTACVVFLRSHIIVTANAGDSRAVLGRSKTRKYVETTFFQAIDLSIDQNPDSPGEMERIQKSGGFVSPPPEPGLSARVWLDKNLSKVGLAMSRSIGDYSVKNVGVIAEPVVSSYSIRSQDEFLILATDGVWEFLSSQDAVDIVGSCLSQGKGASDACQRLIEAAADKWHEFEGTYRDDITAIVIHLKEVYNHYIK